jgi:RNA polymerase sigma factor (sigma-70 family)
MAQYNVGSTDPQLLRRVAALCNNSAWREFFELYAPLVKAWCSAYRLDAASIDELCQRVWVELTRRMPAYQYDPSGSFRGWLRRLCHHRAIDFYRERQNHPFPMLDDEELIDRRWLEGAEFFNEPGVDPMPAGRLRLMREAREIQEEVRLTVKPVRWDVFWRVVIEGEPLSEAARALGLKYATAYAAANHVAHRLREEGERRRARLAVQLSS